VSGVAGSPALAVTVTLLAYLAGCRVQRLCNGSPLANPVLIAILAVAGWLALTGTTYETYFAGAQLIHLLLGPATVALAIPLYRNVAHIRQSGRAILVAVAAGAITAAGTAVLIGWVLGASEQVLRSLAPKSATAPVAIGIASQIGGVPSLTAVLAIATGISGAVLATTVLDMIGLRDWRARGLGTGVASHGIGTARILALDETGGAFAGLGMGLNALATAALLPLAVLALW
jgi:predicted murein hydrolase (TIGR00659 family)